jgi:hypothetical protein
MTCLEICCSCPRLLVSGWAPSSSSRTGGYACALVSEFLTGAPPRLVVGRQVLAAGQPAGTGRVSGHAPLI